MLNLNHVEKLLAKLTIRDRDGKGRVPFKFNPNQQIIMRKLHEWQAKGKPLWYICAKSRRVGISAQAGGLLMCHSLEMDMAEALIVAHQAKSSKELFKIPQMLVKGIPVPGIDTSNQNKIVFPHDHGDSTLTIATAGSVVGGRGMTLTGLHGSEVAYWAGAESFASLLPSVQRSSDSIIVLESTANGTVGIGETFYAYWNAAVEGRNDFCPIFLTHLDDPFCRNFDAVVRDIGEGDIADYEREMVTLMKRRKIGKQEQQERISWVRSTLETQCQGLSIMLEQEYPITAEMAFVSTGLPAFEKSEMSWAEECVQEPKAIGRFASAGDQLAGVWEDRGDGEWHVWEFPLAGCHYYLGADAAAGEELGESGQSRPVGDFSSIYIWNGETGNLAAKMAGRISPDFLADEVNKAGRYYNNAMASIELTGNLGRWALVRLRDKHRYPHFYRWKGRDDYIGKRNMMANKSGIGWDTNPATRELMFSAFRCALREGRIFPRSRALVNQMRNCSRIEGFKWELRRGFDDELCAGLIAWIAREQWAPPVGLGGRRPEEPDGETPMLNRIRVQDDYAGQLQRHVQKVLGYKSQKVVNERLNGV